MEAGELNKARNFLINDLLNNSSSREKIFLLSWNANIKEVVKQMLHSITMYKSATVIINEVMMILNQY